MKKKLLILTLVVLIMSSLFVFAACNKDSETTLLDIYVNKDSVKELSKSSLMMSLPAGWEVDISGSSKYDNGYIDSLDAFVIKNTETSTLSVMKNGAKDMLFPESEGVRQLRVKDGLIAAVKNGTQGAAVYSAKWGLPVLLQKFFKSTDSVDIDKVIKILDGELVAVNYLYDVNGVKGYTSIYRPDNDGGRLVMRVKNESNLLANVLGFDGRYVTVTGNKEDGDGKAISRIFTVPDYAPDGGAVSSDATSNGRVIDNGESDYYDEITYIGGGKFLIHRDWTVDKEDDYTYYYDGEYVVVNRFIYEPSGDRLQNYSSKFIFLKLGNKYYNADKYADDTKNPIATSGFLRGDYMYAAFGLSIEADKTAYYDQFILDGNLNVMLSLSSNFGLKLNASADDVGAFDLIMSFVDGIGYTPLYPSAMRAYDRHGNVVFEDKKYEIVSAGMNNGMIVAQCRDSEDKSTYYYGAYDMSGKLVVPFKYSSLDPFLGYYTIGVREREDGDYEKYPSQGKTSKNVTVLIGKDGKEVEKLSDGSEPLADVATTGNKSKIYKLGCYMFTQTVKEDGKDVTKFGIKTITASVSGESNVIMPATMAGGCTLYSPVTQPQYVFVFDKITATDKSVMYNIYRLS